MSILIKMEMPKNCTECRFAVDGWCYGLTPTEPNSKSLATGTRPSWCPLIELPPHGKWIWKLADNGWADNICSVCGYTINDDIHVHVDYNYCPNCGADMREADGEE